MKNFAFSLIGLAVLVGVLSVAMPAAQAMEEVGVVVVPSDEATSQLPSSWLQTAQATGGVVWDQDCFYDKNGKCRPRVGPLPDRVCTRGTGEGNYCGLVIVFEEDAPPVSTPTCTPSNICSNGQVVNSCTGAVVMTCNAPSASTCTPSASVTAGGPVVGGGQCSGGTVVGTTGEYLDGTQVTGSMDLVWKDSCNELAGGTMHSGQCCEVFMKSGARPSTGGYPGGSRWDVTLYNNSTAIAGQDPKVNSIQCATGGALCSSVAYIAGPSASQSQCSVASCVAGQCTNGGVPGVPNNPDTTKDDTTHTPGVCSAGPICSGVDLHYRNSDCSETLLQQCAFGCAANSCVTTQSSTAPALALIANPPLIKKGGMCSLTFSAKNVTTCTLTGQGINVTIPATGGKIASSTTNTPALFNSATYTLSCKGDTTVTKTVDCKVTPTFTEF